MIEVPSRPNSSYFVPPHPTPPCCHPMDSSNNALWVEWNGNTILSLMETKLATESFSVSLSSQEPYQHQFCGSLTVDMKNLNETTVRVIPYRTIRSNARCVFVRFSYTTLTITRTIVAIHVVSEFTDNPGGCSYTNSGYQVTVFPLAWERGYPSPPLLPPHPPRVLSGNSRRSS